MYPTACPEDWADSLWRQPGSPGAAGSSEQALTPRDCRGHKTVTFDAHPRRQLIVALDFDSLSSAMKFAKQVADVVGLFKIGSQLFTSAGPAAVKEIAALGPGIFLDLKFHDIPNTVAGAVLSAAAMNGGATRNVHALGGSPMLKAAVQAISAGVPLGMESATLACRDNSDGMDQKAMRETGIGGTPQASVLKLAKACEIIRSGRCGRFGPGSKSNSQGLWPRIPHRHAGCSSEGKRKASRRQ